MVCFSLSTMVSCSRARFKVPCVIQRKRFLWSLFNFARINKLNALHSNLPLLNVSSHAMNEFKTYFRSLVIRSFFFISLYSSIFSLNNSFIMQFIFYLNLIQNSSYRSLVNIIYNMMAIQSVFILQKFLINFNIKGWY